jgi:hypothetical protein
MNYDFSRHKPKGMTNRVYEIALKTGGSTYPEVNSERLQYFAENIIEECAKLAEEDTSYPYKTFGDKIRSHFGLKDFI